jgi:tetratricopeptide (TPR) repeat protein
MQQGQIAALSPLGRFDEGIRKFESAIAYLSVAAPADTDARDDLRPILAKLYNAGAEVYTNSGRVNEGLKASRQALEFGEAYARDHPTDPAALHDLMFAYTYTTRKLIVAGNPDEALVVGLRGLELGKATIRDHARDLDLPVVLADLYHNLATLEHPKGQSATALGYTQNAVELTDTVSRANPLLFRPLQVLVDTLSYQSNILSDLGRIAEARQTAERATETVESFLRHTPALFQAQELLGNALAALGKAHLKMADNGRAVANLRRAAKTLETSREAIYLYNAACCLSMASSIDDPTERTDAERQAKRASDADLAVALLRKAIDHGLADLAMVQTDSDLNAIRMRQDFIEILREIEARAKSATSALAPSSANGKAAAEKPKS